MPKVLPMIVSPELSEIEDRLRTQDNRMTHNPMFCVQIKLRISPMDNGYSENQCWWNPEQLECVYDDDPGFVDHSTESGWEGPFGYRDVWETVMVAFTQKGCEEYLELNGHNVKRKAFRGEVRIYVESFYGCPEMIAIRNMILNDQ